MPRKKKTAEITPEEAEKAAKKLTAKQTKATNQIKPEGEKITNKEMLNNLLTLYSLPRIDIHDPEAVRNRIEDYLKFMSEADMRPTTETLCVAIGISLRTLNRWATGITNPTPEHKELAQSAKMLLNAVMSEYMMTNQINVVAGIFFLKNHFGYQDKTAVEVESKNILGDIKDNEQRRSKYIESTVADE